MDNVKTLAEVDPSLQTEKMARDQAREGVRWRWCGKLNILTQDEEAP